MSGRLFISKRRRIMGKYNIGDVWWTHFPFENSNIVKHRPAIVINDDEIAILAMYVTSKDKETPYSIEITDWEQTGLSKVSWARIDRIISISEWNLDRKIGKLTERDLLKILQLVAELTTETFHEFSVAAIKMIIEFWKYLLIGGSGGCFLILEVHRIIIKKILI